jgi:hypothetical protein
MKHTEVNHTFNTVPQISTTTFQKTQTDNGRKKRIDSIKTSSSVPLWVLQDIHDKLKKGLREKKNERTFALIQFIQKKKKS